MTYAVTKDYRSYIKPFAVGRYPPAVRKSYHATRHYGGEAVSFVPKEDGLPVIVAFHSKHKGGIGIGRKESPFGRSFRRAHALSKTFVENHGADNVIFTGVGHGGYIAKTMGGLHDASHVYYDGDKYGGSLKSFFKGIGRGLRKASHAVGKVTKPFKHLIEKVPIVGTAVELGDAIGLDPFDPYASAEKVVNTGKSILK